MKLALLGDIHGNAPALRAVLESAEKEGVEQLLITGDIIGYYFEPAEVMDLLSSWDKAWVRGNHEDMLVQALNNEEYLSKVDAKYGTGLRVAIDTLSTEDIDELCALPHPLNMDIDGCKIMLCHGSPWDVNSYVYPDAEEDLLSRCVDSSWDITILGHTHYPMSKKSESGWIINPGSVGQPRNRKPGAQWGLFDTELYELRLISNSYDAGPVIRDCMHRHPELSYLANVLERL